MSRSLSIVLSRQFAAGDSGDVLNYWVIGAGILTAALTGAGGAEIIKAILARSKRKPRRVQHAESEVSLARAAQEYAQSVEADAKEARTAAQEAWRVVHEAELRQVRLNGKLDEVQYRVSMISNYVNWLVDMIMLPTTTMEDLRTAVTIRKPPIVHAPKSD